MPMRRRAFLAGAAAAFLPAAAAEAAGGVPAEIWAAKLVEAGTRQVGVTLRYDPAYVTLG